MDGFISAQSQQRRRVQHVVMGHYDDRDLPFYWNVADNYVLFDRFFTSAARRQRDEPHVLGHRRTRQPEGRLHPQGGLRRAPTIFDRLEAKGVSWRFYVQNYDPRITFRSRALGDRGSQVVWVPLLDYAALHRRPRALRAHRPDGAVLRRRAARDAARRLLHRPVGLERAPARARSRRGRRSSARSSARSCAVQAVVVLGLHVDLRRLGRLVRPRAPAAGRPRSATGSVPRRCSSAPTPSAGHVEHATMDFTSILKFIEENWGLRPLTDRDRRARSLMRVVRLLAPPAERRLPDPRAQRDAASGAPARGRLRRLLGRGGPGAPRDRVRRRRTRRSRGAAGRGSRGVRSASASEARRNGDPARGDPDRRGGDHGAVVRDGVGRRRGSGPAQATDGGDPADDPQRGRHPRGPARADVHDRRARSRAHVGQAVPGRTSECRGLPLRHAQDPAQDGPAGRRGQLLAVRLERLAEAHPGRAVARLPGADAVRGCPWDADRPAPGAAPGHQEQPRLAGRGDRSRHAPAPGKPRRPLRAARRAAIQVDRLLGARGEDRRLERRESRRGPVLPVQRRASCPIELLFFDLDIASRDALFDSHIGSRLEIVGPDGRTRRRVLDADGRVQLARLPRGVYRVDGPTPTGWARRGWSRCHAIRSSR